MKKYSGKKIHFVTVAFYEGGKKYDYICDDESIKPGDKVKVASYDGIVEVEVLAVSDKAVEELPIPVERYKSIVKE